MSSPRPWLLVFTLAACSSSGVVDENPSATSGAAAGSGVGGGALGALQWPNADSVATSDPWIAEHHDEITVMRPRVMALNFVNARSNDDMVAHMTSIVEAIREASRPHGYAEASEPFLEYEIAYAIDLRDRTPPIDWPYANSTKYPREDPQEGSWGFDYEQLFSQYFAELYGIVGDGKTPLSLCELSERGLVHEVWIYGDADVPDVSAAEVLGLMPHYDDGFRRMDEELDGCAGNGCFDAEDEIPADCRRTLRIGWVNNTRGVGCYMESLSHGIERIGGGDFIPYWKRYFREFGGFDLDERYGLPFSSWYACSKADCLSYPTPGSALWQAANGSGTIDPYLAVCGNAHFPPNARGHYDLVNPQPVLSTCESYRRTDEPKPATVDDWLKYADVAPDCTGAWLIYWWQSFPSREREAQAADGAPMKNWWPFLFY